jgi:hypothetical protein
MILNLAGDCLHVLCVKLGDLTSDTTSPVAPPTSDLDLDILIVAHKEALDQPFGKMLKRIEIAGRSSFVYSDVDSVKVDVLQLFALPLLTRTA